VLREGLGFLEEEGPWYTWIAEYRETWIKTFLARRVELPVSCQVKIKSATLRSGETVWFSAKLVPRHPYTRGNS